MRRKIHLLLPVIALLALMQCETPGSPDFTLSNKIDTPLIAESNFQFLGAKNALLDTTSGEFNELLTIDGDDFITISQGREFDFGELDGAIPEIDVESTHFETTVGEIELNEFSSQDENGNIGEAGFEDLTGQNIPLQEGDLIAGAQSPGPVNIEFDTDYFVSAQIKRGGIEIVLRNELGFDLDNLTIELYSGNQSLGVISINNFIHNSIRSGSIDIVENPETDPEVELKDINADVEISWSTQTMQDDAGSIIVTGINGQELFASAINAVITSQEFFTSGSSTFSDDEIRFDDAEHYVELSSGTLSVDNIINTIDLDIDPLEISFPGFRLPPYGAADTLTIRFEGDQKIPRSNTEPINRSYDLSDVRIYATNNMVEYNIFATTENTRESSGSDSREIEETDLVSAEVNLTDLTIREAFGVVASKQLLLNNDVAGDGESVDIMNDLEAELIEIDGIKEISKRLEGIEFTRASLSVNYATNIGVPTTIIGAFLGVDADGNEFFLKGKPGTDTEVTSNDPTQKLHMNGSPIDPFNLIKFRIEPNQSPEEILSNHFDRTNSSISEFLNRFPTVIRFVGLALVNPENGEGTIRNPIEFDPNISLNIPLALKANSATFTDTTSVNLVDLPGSGDNSFLDEGSVIIRYSNNIPLGLDLDLEFLTEAGAVITAVPLLGDPSVALMPAITTNGGGFSVSPSEDFATIQLNRSQLDEINQTRNVRLVAALNTSNAEEVRIRTTDNVSVEVSGKFVIRNKID